MWPVDVAPDPELRRLTMRAEVGAESPLWTERGHMVWLDQLPISEDLQHALGRWAEQVLLTAPEPWQAEGDALYAQVVAELGPGYEVVLDVP